MAVVVAAFSATVPVATLVNTGALSFRSVTLAVTACSVVFVLSLPTLVAMTVKL